MATYWSSEIESPIAPPSPPLLNDLPGPPVSRKGSEACPPKLGNWSIMGRFSMLSRMMIWSRCGANGLKTSLSVKLVSLPDGK